MILIFKPKAVYYPVAKPQGAFWISGIRQVIRNKNSNGNPVDQERFWMNEVSEFRSYTEARKEAENLIHKIRGLKLISEKVAVPTSECFRKVYTKPEIV